MRTLTRALVACSALALATAASAADLPRSAPHYAAPAYSASYDWSGFALGLQGGPVSGTSLVDGTIAGFGTFASGSAHGTGAAVGIFGRYLWQSSSLVYGIEGDLNLGGPRGTTNLVGVDGTFKTRWEASLRPVVGVALNRNWLLYAMAGVDIAHFGFSASGLGVDEAWSTTKTGWTAGVGADYRINRDWFAGLQYRHSDFGALSHDLVTVPGVSVGNKMTSDALMVRVGWQGNLF